MDGNIRYMLLESLDFFLYASLKLAFLFVAISIVVGALNEFLPAHKMRKLLSARRGQGYMVGAGLGALTPFCSCSTIPVVVGLLKARAGFGPSMSFLFASPLVNPVIIGLFFTVFGLKITIGYSVLALGMAMTAGYLLSLFGFERHIREDAIDPRDSARCGCAEEAEASIQEQASITRRASGTSGCCASEPPSAPVASPCCDAPPSVSEAPSSYRSADVWIRILQEALAQFRTFLPYILIGIAIGAILHGFIPGDLIKGYAGSDNPLAIPAAAFIGVPLYVRASTMIPIAFSLVEKGMSLGAVIALVIGGAGASLPEVIMLKRIFRPPILIAFLVAVFGIAVSSGYLLNALP